MKINEHYGELAASYLFSTVAKKQAEFSAAHPEKEIIRLSIGDVTQPLARCVVKAMQEAAAEMGTKEGFHGYGPEQGYDFLKEAVCGYYAARGTRLDKDEIFISDGAKSDLANVLGLFSVENTVLVPDPVYPAYVDDNVTDGRRIVYAKADEANGFLPMPDENVKADIIYLCSPNNPTGAAYTRAQLAEWVAYAKKNDAVILYDAAYECFIQDAALARSIFEVEGARACAIEICSFSKIAGFTGTRCGYTVVPAELKRGGMSLNKLWLRRQTTKFNGVPYIVQRGAAAVFTESGMQEIQENLDYYRRNAAVIAAALDAAGVWYCGGKNSPYLWLRCPGGMKSWEFFDWLLETCGVVGTPGVGFGACGEGYFRLTAFGDAEKTKLAAAKMQKALLQLRETQQ
ncbi:MAG: LL-diaminopimelate aminotransferase [Faecalibacterium sp.]|jgi:LL-diaminopimelate aminotransferase|nr:LL-diaminopimelate aminotransferase [Faecalibacterium sp.]